MTKTTKTTITSSTAVTFRKEGRPGRVITGAWYYIIVSGPRLEKLPSTLRYERRDVMVSLRN